MRLVSVEVLGCWSSDELCGLRVWVRRRIPLHGDNEQLVTLLAQSSYPTHTTAIVAGVSSEKKRLYAKWG